MVVVARACQGGFAVRARLIAMLVAGLCGRVICIAVVLASTVRRPRERVGVILMASVTAAATVVLLALGRCMQLIGPTDRVRLGRRVFQVCETLHPVREGAATTIAVYQSALVSPVDAFEDGSAQHTMCPGRGFCRGHIGLVENLKNWNSWGPEVRNVQVDGEKAIEKRLLEGPGRSAAPDEIRTAKDARE